VGRQKGVSFMKRFMAVLTIVLLSSVLTVVLPASGGEPETLTLGKPCVIVGRVLGADIGLFPVGEASGAGEKSPEMTRLRGFELLNLTSGDWIPLSLSSEGYFCANVRMGEYDLRGRDSKGLPYLIHRFNVPLNMAVNLGTFRVETSRPDLVTVELWPDYSRTANWREYREGAGHVAFRLKHETGQVAYEDCEKWFAGCYADIYKHFENVMARR